MNKRKVTQYSEEFKRSSAELAVSSSTQPMSVTARELGVNGTTLYGWVAKYCPNKSSTSSMANSADK